MDYVLRSVVSFEKKKKIVIEDFTVVYRDVAIIIGVASVLQITTKFNLTMTIEFLPKLFQKFLQFNKKNFEDKSHNLQHKALGM